MTSNPLSFHKKSRNIRIPNLKFPSTITNLKSHTPRNNHHMSLPTTTQSNYSYLSTTTRTVTLTSPKQPNNSLLNDSFHLNYNNKKNNNKRIHHSPLLYQFIPKPKLFQTFSSFRKGIPHHKGNNSNNTLYKYKPACSMDLHDKVNKLIRSKKHIEIESKDKVNENAFQYGKLHKLIRKHLLQDINPVQQTFTMNKKFYTMKENKVNYINDILIVPHLQNKLMFKNITNDTVIKDMLTHQNCLSKYNQQSINKERRKRYFTTNNNIITEEQTETETNNSRPRSTKGKLYEELEYYDYFTKTNLYKHTSILNVNHNLYYYKHFFMDK